MHRVRQPDSAPAIIGRVTQHKSNAEGGNMTAKMFAELRLV